jgi:hypothetical protein
MKSFVMPESLAIKRLWSIRMNKKKEEKKRKFIRQRQKEY